MHTIKLDGYRLLIHMARMKGDNQYASLLYKGSSCKVCNQGLKAGLVMNNRFDRQVEVR